MKLTQDAVLLDGLVIVGKVVVYHVWSVLLLEPGFDVTLIHLSYTSATTMTYPSCTE